MRTLGIPPRTDNWDRPATTTWLSTIGERLEVYRGANDPTTSESPEGQWFLYHNTTASEVRFWIKIDGVMFKSAAFT